MAIQLPVLLLEKLGWRPEPQIMSPLAKWVPKITKNKQNTLCLNEHGWLENEPGLKMYFEFPIENGEFSSQLC